jgi:hypothetical protein
LWVRGDWVWRWKDRIDRRFVERFTVLADDGSLAADFRDAARMAQGSEAMECGGCATRADGARGARATPRPVDPSVVLASRPDDAATGADAALFATVDASPSRRPGRRRVVASTLRATSSRLAAPPAHALAVTVPERPKRGEMPTSSGIRAALDRSASSGQRPTGGTSSASLLRLGEAPPLLCAAPATGSLTTARTGVVLAPTCVARAARGCRGCASMLR